MTAVNAHARTVLMEGRRRNARWGLEAGPTVQGAEPGPAPPRPAAVAWGWGARPAARLSECCLFMIICQQTRIVLCVKGGGRR